MKIEYIYEAGVFGSYKKTNVQSNIDNAKKELTRDALNSVLAKQCDELAELYLNMLDEVNSHINAISRKYKCKINSSRTEESYLVELSRYMTRYYERSRKKEIQLNLIKNIYCNRQAIEYMMSQGCFILPIVDIYRPSSFFYNTTKEIIPYKNMIKTVAKAAEKVIKTHLSKFPSYTSIIPNNVPNNVKLVVLQSEFWRGRIILNIVADYHSRKRKPPIRGDTYEKLV